MITTGRRSRRPPRPAPGGGSGAGRGGAAGHLVAVVDDDDDARRGLRRLLSSAGFDVRTFASGDELLDAPAAAEASCLVLDLRLPEQTGLELQSELEERGASPPIVFLTGYGTVPDSVRAMKDGAVDFLEKPAPAEDLVAAVRKAITRGIRERRRRRRTAELRRRLESLTPREREVMGYVVGGRLNKQTAYALGVTEKTIKVHRARVMSKMCADSLAHLVRMAEYLGIEPETG